MNHWILFLHIVGAITMGFYFVLPFLLGRVGKLSGPALTNFVSALRSTNKYGQFVLLFEFLTGGYMVSKYTFSTIWLILVLVFLVAFGAVSGIMGARMKKVVDAGESGSSVKPHLDSATVLSWISAVFLLVIVYLMNNISSIL